ATNRALPSPSSVARSTRTVKYMSNEPSSVLVSVPCPLEKKPIGGSPKSVVSSCACQVPFKGNLPAFTAGLESATVKNIAAIKLIVFIMIGFLLVVLASLARCLLCRAVQDAVGIGLNHFNRSAVGSDEDVIVYPAVVKREGA